MSARTRKQIISDMSEREFRAKILIPLFYEMGFREVADFHGGSLEKGKDIIFWKNDTFDVRQNYGVIVKAGDISGSVSNGARGMPAILTQIEQTLSNEFISTTDGREYEISRGVLATNGKIHKEAMESIRGQLRAHNLNKVLTFLHIENILDYIDKYLPTLFQEYSVPYRDLAVKGATILKALKTAHPEIEFPAEANVVIDALVTGTGPTSAIAAADAAIPYIINASGDAIPADEVRRLFQNEDPENNPKE